MSADLLSVSVTLGFCWYFALSFELPGAYKIVFSFQEDQVVLAQDLLIIFVLLFKMFSLE